MTRLVVQSIAQLGGLDCMLQRDVRCLSDFVGLWCLSQVLHEQTENGGVMPKIEFIPEDASIAHIIDQVGRTMATYMRGSCTLEDVRAVNEAAEQLIEKRIQEARRGGS